MGIKAPYPPSPYPPKGPYDETKKAESLGVHESSLRGARALDRGRTRFRVLKDEMNPKRV